MEGFEVRTLEEYQRTADGNYELQP